MHPMARGLIESDPETQVETDEAVEFPRDACGCHVGYCQHDGLPAGLEEDAARGRAR